MCIITIVPNHKLVFGVARSTPASHQREYVSFVDHFNNADSCPELSVYLLGDFMTELKYPESFLCANSEIWLILVETNVNYLLFLLIHLYIAVRIAGDDRIINIVLPIIIMLLTYIKIIL